MRSRCQRRVREKRNENFTLKPNSNTSPIVLRLALPRTQRIQQRIRQNIVPKLGQIPRRFNNRSNQIIITLDLLQRDSKDDCRIRMRDLPE